MPVFELTVKPIMCKGCGICVEVCDEKCFAIRDSFNQFGHYYPEPVAMENCTGCGACAKLCPDFAITVYKVVEEKSDAA